MNTSADFRTTPEPVGVRVARGKLSVDLTDGRTVSVPLEWYPRLSHGTPAEWRNYELGYAGIHWPDLNEDISIEALLTGRKSGESARSLRRWLNYRAKGMREPIPELPLPASLKSKIQKVIAADHKKTRPHRRKAG